MLPRLTLVLIALACGAAAPAPKAAPAKPAVAKPTPAAKPAATAPAAYDGRDPASLVGVLAAAGAEAKVAQKVEDTVLVGVTSAAANFTVQFVGCDAQGRACQAALYDSGPMPGSPTLAQLNGYNQSSAMCRSFQDKAGKAHVVFSTLVSGATREQTRTQLAAWQGCIGDFRTFAKDPVGYLASAP